MYYNHNAKFNTTEKVLVLDMDGTLADLYGVDDWLNKLRSESPAPYIEAPAMWNMAALARVLEEMQVAGWRIVVCSWLSKDCPPLYAVAIRRAKREWLTDWQVPFDEVHFVKYGTRKDEVVRNLPAGSWLVDDDRRVREDWEAAKGQTIDPTATHDLPGLLRQMFLSGKTAE